MATGLSVIIPASNEAEHIGACLDALFRSAAPDGDVQVVVVPNGCRDATPKIARSYADAAQARGWTLDIVELAQGSKLAALDAGDAAALYPARAYVDADVVVSGQLVAQTLAALDCDDARYVTGEVRLAYVPSWVTRAYGRFYRQVPFMQQTAPGCGYFAVNRAGRARWGTWPQIISDDTFARLSFAPNERVQVAAAYDWPLVEGFANLVKVRRRQNAGVDEITARFPALQRNDSKLRFGTGALISAALRAPLGFVIYGAVALCVKLTPARNRGWDRGR